MFIKKLHQQVICNHHEPIAHTPLGQLRGVKTEDAYIFRGIRYAHARRFHMPEAEEAWEGVRDAIIYGFVCPEITTPVPHDQFTVPHVFYPQHENCQYLNVWTQSLDANAKRPVMVWLHGGGYATGSGIEHYAYDGEELSKAKNVVVVTLNHRLNVLGYLDLSAYGEEYALSGNVGMADIVEALKWVKQNIAAFGGDPDNVTIFGQSGGGGKVTTLLQMPAADGLYHRAVIQSGVMDPGPAARVREKNKRLTEMLLEELGMDASRVSELEDMPYARLSAAADRANIRLNEETGERFMWAPVPDGSYYVGYPFETGFRKETLHIPVMMGTVFAEFTSNFDTPAGNGLKNAWTREEAMHHLKEKFGDAAEKMAAAFEEAYPGRTPADALFADTFVRRATVRLAKQRAGEGGSATFVYLFDLESPFNDGTLAWHNAEIPYVFHNAQYLEPSYIPGVTEKLQEEMSGAWAAFAEKGDPNHPGHPVWHPVTGDACPTMIYAPESAERTDHDAAFLDAAPKGRVLPVFLQKKKEPSSSFGPQSK